MEYYILDDQLRRDSVIEGFSTLIWTERMQTPGDFEIVTKATSGAKSRYTKGVKLGRAGSGYVMVIDTVKTTVNEDGETLLDITGKSFENLLEDRVAMPALTDLTTTPKWIIGPDTPANIMRTIFNTICVAGALSPLDTIPFYTSGTISTPGSITEPTDIITVTLDPASVYTDLNSLATTYNLGFRLIKDGDTGHVYFEVYTGNDCTSGQTDRPAVIFSETMENLTNKSVVDSNASYKTVAYVYSQNGAQVVYSPIADQTASGLDRRVLYVDASDLDTAAGPDLVTALTQRGLAALAAQAPTYSFDGETPGTGGYTYGVDYLLGDVVEERDTNGFGNQMRVTEMIFTSDNTGEKAYPTLSINNVITPGTWSAWDQTQTWSAVDPAVHWADV
jgi:hypothetical protein